MRRLFGGPGKPQPTVDLDEATKKLDDRVGGLDEKIKKLDAELMQYREQMKKTKPGTGARNVLQQKAMRVLKQKKIYEQQRDQYASQSFNMEQANFATQTMKDTVTTVTAMKQANVTMKQQFKNINIDEIQDVHDDLQDLMEENNEIQEVLSKSFGNLDYIDEQDLEDELSALGEELYEEESVPSYLNSLPSTDTTDPTKKLSQPTPAQF